MGGAGNFNLGAWLGGGGRLGRAKKLAHTLHIITGNSNDPHSAISINNTEHIAHNTGTNWDEGHIGKRISVLHRDLRDVQALKTTRPIVLLESQGAVLGQLVASESFIIAVKKGRINGA